MTYAQHCTIYKSMYASVESESEATVQEACDRGCLGIIMRFLVGLKFPETRVRWYVNVLPENSLSNYQVTISKLWSNGS